MIEGLGVWWQLLKHTVKLGLSGEASLLSSTKLCFIKVSGHHNVVGHQDRATLYRLLFTCWRFHCWNVFDRFLIDLFIFYMVLFCVLYNNFFCFFPIWWVGGVEIYCLTPLTFATFLRWPLFNRLQDHHQITVHCQVIVAGFTSDQFLSWRWTDLVEAVVWWWQ